MKTRIIHTRFWNDSFIETLSAKEKLLFIYLLTNEKVNLIGVYEISDKHIKGDLELTQAELNTAKKKFHESGKILFCDGWVKITNHNKYNAYRGEKIEKAIQRELMEAPKDFSEYIYPLDTSIDTSMYTLNNHNIDNIYKEYIDIWNMTYGTKYSSFTSIKTNLDLWLKSYTIEEIKLAVTKIKSDAYWKDKDLSPEWLLRTREKGEPVDRIGRMLNIKSRSVGSTALTEGLGL